MMRPETHAAVYVCVAPVDMRKQAATLALIIEGETVTIRGEQLEELLAGFDLWRQGHRELLMRRVG